MAHVRSPCGWSPTASSFYALQPQSPPAASPPRGKTQGICPPDVMVGRKLGGPSRRRIGRRNELVGVVFAGRDQEMRRGRILDTATLRSVAPRPWPVTRIPTPGPRRRHHPLGRLWPPLRGWPFLSLDFQLAIDCDDERTSVLPNASGFFTSAIIVSLGNSAGKAAMAAIGFKPLLISHSNDDSSLVVAAERPDARYNTIFGPRCASKSFWRSILPTLGFLR